MRIWWCSIVLVLGCSHPTPAPAPGPVVGGSAGPVTLAAPPADAAGPGASPALDVDAAPPPPPPPPPDAAVATVVAPAFVPPAPLGKPGPPTPGAKRCRTTADADQNHEDQRRYAAIDIALRAQGLTPLAVHPGRVEQVSRPIAPGTRAQPAPSWQGQQPGYLLVVGRIGGCAGVPPIVAMTASHEVFVVEPVMSSKHHRTVLLCQNTCRGICGARMADRVALADVPSDAVLGASREIKVPLDTEVTFRFARTQPCNLP